MATAARVWLCVPPAAACCADVVATLWGQGDRYWAGDRQSVVEFNPIARMLLEAHPLAFVSAAVLSCALVALAVFLLNRRLALVLAFAVTFGHAVAAAAWAARAGAGGAAFALMLLVATERAVELSWRRSGAVPAQAG